MEAVNVLAVLAIKKNTARIIKTFLIRAFSEMYKTRKLKVYGFYELPLLDLNQRHFG